MHNTFYAISEDRLRLFCDTPPLRKLAGATSAENAGSFGIIMSATVIFLVAAFMAVVIGLGYLGYRMNQK